MNRSVLIAVLIVPLAWLAGRWTRPPLELPAGAVTAVPASRPDLRWDELQQRAGLSLAGLQRHFIHEISMTSGYSDLDSWLMEHLIGLDGKGTWRRVKEECGDLHADRFARWWTRLEPRDAVPFLLREPAVTNEDPNVRGSLFLRTPVDVSQLGGIDPGLTLELVNGLPLKHRKPDYFRALLQGLAEKSPDRVFEVLDQIRASPGFSETAEVSEVDLLPVLAKVDPARAVGWAEARFGTLTVPVLEKLIEGCAEVDVSLAAGLYERLWESGGIRHKAAGAITRGLAAGDLEEGFGWIEKNAPVNDVAGLNSSLLQNWARLHPAAAIERYLAGPARWPRIGEETYLFMAAGKEKELVDSLDKLPAKEAERLRGRLVKAGLLPMPAAKPDPLALLKRDRASARELWKKLTDAEKEVFAERVQFADEDPAFVLELLAETKSGIDRPAGHRALSRLALLDAEAASRIAGDLERSQGRVRAIGNVYRNRAPDDRAAAAAWRNGIPDSR